MVKLAKSFSFLKPVKAIVLGDFMLDVYTKGTVQRISPEAPVPILKVSGKESLPGGAGNVVLNLRALGAEVVPFGRIGDDPEGNYLKELIAKDCVNVDNFCQQKNYPTTVKNRLIADSQQLVRIDQEAPLPLSKTLENRLLANLKKEIPKAQIIAVSDYNKGFLTKSFLKKIHGIANQHNIPIIIDPKGEDFSKYFGATLIKPNLKEARLAAKMAEGSHLEDIAKKLLKASAAKYLLVTRSEKGMTLFGENYAKDFSVNAKEVKDVTGAGDTVLSVMAFSMANQIPIEDAVQLANIAGGIVVERLGCVRVNLSELAERLLLLDTKSKIFSESHLYVLKEALKKKTFRIIGLDPEEVSLPKLYEELVALKQKDSSGKIILYLQSVNKQMSSLLSSLHEVDFVLQGNASLLHLEEMISPVETFVLEEDKLFQVNNPLSLLRKLQKASLA
ncbi:MAG: hypothetical protein Tsb0015_04550 [Simkaniaceae bacterium]